MRDDPHGDNLAKLMAAEEAGIRDDGFSDRVADGMHRHLNIRLAVISGAGLAGLGFAVGSLPALVRAIPPLKVGLDVAVKTPDLLDLPAYARLADSSQLMALAFAGALALGVASVMLALRER